MHLLILAGTSEARSIISALRDDMGLRISASLAGATSSPIDLMVPTRKGGFGGADGLADYCREQMVDAIVDLTHPYATQISHNARDAAILTGLPLVQFIRPEWQAGKGDNWRYFDSWQDMIDSLPTDARVFLAGGSSAMATFSHAKNIQIWARGLNVITNIKSHKFKIIKSIPNRNIEEEIALFKSHDITHICAKNSGGTASSAKLLAARTLGLPVWLLVRPAAEWRNNAKNGDFDHFVSDDLDEILRHIRSRV